MGKNMKKPKTNINLKCESCETKLFQKGGYGGTGLCGVCATGESELLNEAGETW